MTIEHHDACMRTTVTLEPDVAARLKELAHRRRASFKETLNDVLRQGLSSQAGTRESPERYVVQAHAGGFRPGIDPGKLNQLVDELEAGDFVAETSASE
jgi:predicted transcriptional regulator